ncbi:hypothetical protein ACW9HJ_20210 [Nocardia gipuzkoensis]
MASIEELPAATDRPNNAEKILELAWGIASGLVEDPTNHQLRQQVWEAKRQQPGTRGRLGEAPWLAGVGAGRYDQRDDDSFCSKIGGSIRAR